MNDTFIMTLVFTVLGFLAIAFVLFAMVALSCLVSITLVTGMLWLEEMVSNHFRNIFGNVLFVILRVIRTLCYCIPFVTLVILVWKGISFPLF